MLDRVFTLIAAVVYWPIFSLEQICQLFLTGLHIHGTCSKEDKARFDMFDQQVHHGIVVFNHPTIFDHIVLIKELGPLRFVALASYLPGPFAWIARYMKTIIIQRNSGSAHLLSKEISKPRNPSQDVLIAISPSGGYNTVDGYPAEYRTGGFLSKPAVLPVIIKYNRIDVWHDHESIFDMLWKRLRGPTICYQLHVLDPVYPEVFESVAEYAKRTHHYVIQEWDERTKYMLDSTLTSSSLCFTTSHLFLLCGLYQIHIRRQLLYGMGMILVYATSICFHGFGKSHYREIDLMSNILCATIFSGMLWREAKIMPLLCLCVATGSYILGWHHVWFVHIPIVCGFLFI